tara:strand:- start:261 stop:659 length:399 start_codon:yes stop_codon:yes gene_type:complete
VIGALNPSYHGTRPLNQAFRNRFAIKIDFPYLKEVEKELLVSGNLLNFADSLRLRFDVGDLTTPVSTNMLLEFEEFAHNDTLGFDFAVENFIGAFTNEEQAVVREVLVMEGENIRGDLFELEGTDDASEGGE